MVENSELRRIQEILSKMKNFFLMKQKIILHFKSSSIFVILMIVLRTNYLI